MIVSALLHLTDAMRGGEMARSNVKVAVVTGASKGIGAGIAEKLARGGAATVVNYASDSDARKVLVANQVSWGTRCRCKRRTSVSSPISESFRFRYSRVRENRRGTKQRGNLRGAATCLSWTRATSTAILTSCQKGCFFDSSSGRRV